LIIFEYPVLSTRATHSASYAKLVWIESRAYGFAGVNVINEHIDLLNPGKIADDYLLCMLSPGIFSLGTGIIIKL